MRPMPKSRFINDDGSVDWQSEAPEYPDRVAWDKEFEAECDRLAESDAAETGKPHWGRWYLTQTSLATKTVWPEIEGQREKLYVGEYYIELDRLDIDWVTHLGRKNWIGEKGLEDLAKAIESLGNSHSPLLAG